MFTGIVEEMGEVVGLERLTDSARLRVRTGLPVQQEALGSSIAVDGVCLTMIDFDSGGFTADVMAETLDRSTLGGLNPGDRVNLERALPAAGRLDGHIVQGHVDGTGRVRERTPGERWDVVRVELPAELAKYVAEKGSIAINGTSLTVVGVTDGDGSEPSSFTVALIPETLTRTTLGTAEPGTAVNLEVDVIAKYLERLTTVGRAAPHQSEQISTIGEAVAR